VTFISKPAAISTPYDNGLQVDLKMVCHEPTMKLNCLERDVTAGQEETAQFVKWIKRESAQSHFKRIGNKKQVTK